MEKQKPIKMSFIFLGVLILCVFLKLITATAYKSNMADPGKKTGLPALIIKETGSYKSEKGIKLKYAEEILIKYMIKQGVKGDIRKSIGITEITVKAAWENSKLQIYRVKLAYALIDAIMIIKDKRVLCMLNGMPTTGVFLADLDRDGSYEVYTNTYFGSGIVSKDIAGYNIVKHKSYYLSKRMLWDLTLFIKDRELWAERVPSMLSSYSGKTSGRLILARKGDGEELSIEGDEVYTNDYRSFFRSAKKLKVELVGTQNSYVITNPAIIKRIAELLNNTAYLQATKSQEADILLSSAGWIRLTPDDDNNRQLNVYHTGGIYVTKEDMKRLGLTTNLCYFSKEVIKELYLIINQNIL